MSQENIELFERANAALNPGEFSYELAAKVLAPGYRIENASTALFDKTYYGVDGVREWIADTFEGLDPNSRFETEEIITDGDDFVVARVRLVGHGANSGAPVTLRWTAVAWFEGGKMTRGAGYVHRREALEAVGLEEQAMSQENLELVRSISAAHERGDYGSAEWAHPEIEYVIVGGLTPGSWKGRAAMARAARDLFSTWDEHRTQAEDYRVLDGERVLMLGHTSGRGKASGIELDAAQRQVAALYQVRDGKVIRHVIYLDRADAFADLGIEE